MASKVNSEMNIFIFFLMSVFDIWKDNLVKSQKKKKTMISITIINCFQCDASSQVRLFPIAESGIRKVYERSIFVNAILSFTRAASSVEIIGN